MSNYEKIAVGKEVESFDTSPQFDAYSGVIIVDSEGNEELVGTDTGRTITIPGITREQAQAILADLTQSGFQYQPYVASGAILNPAAELGDGVTINGTYSGIYKMSRDYSPLMAADIEAPQDEEIDHEYPYEPKQDRIFKREIAQAMTRISQTEEAITLEAQRATSAEGVLRSSITQTATDINATVSAKLDKSGGSSSSFGWTLTNSSWELKSNNTTVFKATSSGVEVKGKITATSGYIGNGSSGFTITSSALYNGMTSRDDSSHNGVYIGTNGIGVGKGNFRVGSDGAVNIGWGNFRVDTSGNVRANNMTLTGRLNIGGTTITAEALRAGAQSAYSNGGTWTGTSNAWGNATNPNGGKGPSVFKADFFNALRGITTDGTTTIKGNLYIQGGAGGQYLARWKTIIVNGVSFIALCQA